MSILMMSQVWALENLEPAEKLVLLAIADFADDQGQAWPSIPTLARKSSLSEDTVRRKIRKISTDGILSISPRKDKTGRDTSYTFRLFPKASPFVPLFGEENKLPPEPSPNFSILGEGSNVPPLQPARVEGSTVQGGGLQGATLILEPSFKHQKETSNYISDFFETLWKDYPAKNGNKGSKKKALVHFKSTVKSEADCQKIRKALDNYLTHLHLSTWKHPKNGETWFGNWMDWIDWEGDHTPQPPARCAGTQSSTTLEGLRAKGIDV